MRILMVGDVMLGRQVNDWLKKSESHYPWGDTLPVFRKADVRVCNLECVLSAHDEPWDRVEKEFHFRSDVKNASVLKVAGIDLVSTANNHSLDFGPAALNEMIHILNRNHIGYSGAGMVPSQASQVAILENSGKKIGFLAITDNEPEWEVSETSPGVYYVPIELRDSRAIQLLKSIQIKKQEMDVFIVSVHWGPNWGRHPSNKEILFAHALIDSGADIVYGHSPHIFRGIEYYKNHPILYSTGNFIDDYAVDEEEKNDESFIFVCVLCENSGFRLRLYPTLIKNYQAQMATGKRAVRIANHMTELCREFETDCDWNPSEKCLEVQCLGDSRGGPI